MRRLVYILNIETLKVLYFAHFNSLTKYVIIFWDNSTTIHKVLIVQKKILKTLLGIGPRYTCKSWLVKINILPVSCLCISLLIIFVFNNLGDFKTNSSLHDLILGAKINYIFHQ
jgi:hypothetical protein